MPLLPTAAEVKTCTATIEASNSWEVLDQEEPFPFWKSHGTCASSNLKLNQRASEIDLPLSVSQPASTTNVSAPFESVLNHSPK
jgi:hypothetical protein